MTEKCKKQIGVCFLIVASIFLTYTWWILEQETKANEVIWNIIAISAMYVTGGSLLENGDSSYD